MSVVDRTSSEFKDYLELYSERRCWSWASWPTPSVGGSTRSTVVTYIIDRNINYTNVCVADCGFCAFYRRPKHDEGYVLSFEQIGAKIDECKAIGGVQILLQGGHNPYIPFEWYLELMRYIKRHHPIHIHGFSPSEVVFFSERFGLSVADVIRELKAAGLDSIPGGGGEILVDEIRERVAKKKAQTEEWLGVQEKAHRQGMKTSVTMMYGLGETHAERIEHSSACARCRRAPAASPRSSAGRSSPRARRACRTTRRPTPSTYLRTLAMRGSCCDNVPNLQSSLGDDGAEGRADGAALRRQRLRLPHDGGERRLGRRHDVSHDHCTRSSGSSATPAIGPMRRRQDYTRHRGAGTSRRDPRGDRLRLPPLRRGPSADPRRRHHSPSARTRRALRRRRRGARADRRHPRRRGRGRHRPAVSRQRSAVEGRRLHGAAAHGARARARPRATLSRRRTAPSSPSSRSCGPTWPPWPPRSPRGSAWRRRGQRQGEDQRRDGLHRPRRRAWPSSRLPCWRRADRVPAGLGLATSRRSPSMQSSRCSRRSRTWCRLCPRTPPWRWARSFAPRRHHARSRYSSSPGSPTCSAPPACTSPPGGTAAGCSRHRRGGGCSRPGRSP